jgi:hypothetical protein|eukprot:COSAG03_NODE_262_length_9773_cov_9.719454_3_plen_84_part_00
MPASGRTDGRGLLQGESEEAALQLERQRNKDRVLIGASIAVYTVSRRACAQPYANARVLLTGSDGLHRAWSLLSARKLRASSP